MPNGSIDPTNLEGDALTRWYLRSPADIEQERQAAAARRYEKFFGGYPGVDLDSAFEGETPAFHEDVDPAFAVSSPSTSPDADPEFTWVQAGPNRWRSVRVASEAQASSSASPGLSSFNGTTPEISSAPPFGPDDVGPQDRDEAKPTAATSELGLMPQPIFRTSENLRGPPTAGFGPPQIAAAPRVRLSTLPARSSAMSARVPVSNAGYPAPPAARSQAGQTIGYGALRAPAPSDQELVELRRQQAAFSATTRKIDLQNSWFAAPVLAAPLVATGLEGAAAWAARTALPEIEQAPLQFIEREPYLRVGDNWATRAGRRAHAALREMVNQKPGWDPEPSVPLRDGRIVRPDVRTPPRVRKPGAEPKPYQMELKPNTPSGRRAAARALKKYEGTEVKTRPIFYDPKPFI